MTSCFRQLILVAVLVCFGAACHVHAIPGQPGTLDASWATLSPLGAGKLITPVGGSDDTAYAIALQPDGKVLLGGSCVGAANTDFCTIRYLPNGTLDTTWNGAGAAITPIGGGNDVGRAIALQPDGKVVLAGFCNGAASLDFCAARYLPNGTLDTTWNGTGKVITPVSSGSDIAYAIAVQPDGKVLLGGSCVGAANTDFCTIRYLPNGTLDTTWNGTGIVVTSIGSGVDTAYAMVVQPDGKVLLSGGCVGATNNDFCAVRYLPNGTLDSTWNGIGTVITPISVNNDGVNTMALQPDGKVLLAGTCSNGTNNDFCSARYLPNGTLDTTWNGTGKIVTPIMSGDEGATAVIVQPDGKVSLSGYCVAAASIDFCTVRYLPNGTLDTTWNGNGTAITAVGSGGDVASATILQPDGKVLLAGSCYNGANTDFCSVRYDGGPFGYQNCKPDFDGDGVVLPTTDALILTRVSLGITGNAVVGGIAFAPHAARNTWPLIRDYLVTQCGMSMMQ